MLPKAQYQAAIDTSTHQAPNLTRALEQHFAATANIKQFFCSACTEHKAGFVSSPQNDNRAMWCVEALTTLDTHLEFTQLDASEQILCIVTFGRCRFIIDDLSIDLTEQQACILKQVESTVTLQLHLHAHAHLLFINIPTTALHEFRTANPATSCFVPRDIHEDMRREILAIMRDDSHPQVRNTLNLHRATTLTLLHFRQLLTHNDERSKTCALKNEDVQKFKSIQQRIHENYLNPPTLSELAKEVGINKNKLCKGFKTVFGMSIANYVQHYRLELARTLLNKSNYNIAFIADAVGYEHAGNFTAAFKKKYGELPKAARHVDSL